GVGEGAGFGEDVKVMAIRRDEDLQLLVSCAMIDAALNDVADYRKTVERAAELSLEAAAQATSLRVTVGVNAADDITAGRIYLTVAGASRPAAEVRRRPR